VRALVTGAEGFAGGHILRTLLDGGHEVWGTSLDAFEYEGVPMERLDVTNEARCREVVSEIHPDWLFHLAGWSHVGLAEKNPDACLDANFGGTRSVVGACLSDSPLTRVIVISSAEVYGRVAADAPALTETDPVRPATVYAVSKAAGELAAHHAHARGLDVVIVRPFNHIGPGQSPDFVCSAFARQIAAIEAGRQEAMLRVGNLLAVRDFSNVRDAVSAYIGVAESGVSGEVYNVTSGAGVTIRAVLTTLISMCKREVRVETDPTRLRPLDTPVLHGSGEKLARVTGHDIGFDLEQTLREVLDYWREVIASEAER
jgi:GDP-4-dehydro-6-deoxy-D-mannose reductase